MDVRTSVTFDFGDDAYTFRLALGQLRELQERTGVGPLALYRRFKSGDWRVDDAREVIRLGLIGGGVPPTDALALVRRYVDERPIAESDVPASLILAAALFGVEDKPPPTMDQEDSADSASAPINSGVI